MPHAPKWRPSLDRGRTRGYPSRIMNTRFAAKWLLIAPLLMSCGGALDDDPPATPPPLRLHWRSNRSKRRSLTPTARRQRAHPRIRPLRAAFRASACRTPRPGGRELGAARLQLPDGPVGLHGRARLDLGAVRNLHGRCRGRTLRVPLHSSVRLDLVPLALGVGPLSLRRVVPAPVAPCRLAPVLGGAPARGRAARPRAIPPAVVSRW